MISAPLSGKVLGRGGLEGGVHVSDANEPRIYEVASFALSFRTFRFQDDDRKKKSR
jgi:hypothetical protein